RGASKIAGRAKKRRNSRREALGQTLSDLYNCSPSRADRRANRLGNTTAEREATRTYGTDRTIEDGHRFQSERSLPRRLGAQGDRARRARNAGLDDAARRVRQEEAVEGRAHLGLAAHDH